MPNSTAISILLSRADEKNAARRSRAPARATPRYPRARRVASTASARRRLTRRLRPN